MSPERFATVFGEEEYASFEDLIARADSALRGRVVWSVNSTARGGGVVEMLRSLLAYARGAGVDSRWLVIGGDPEFFAITKRLHNHLHGAPGDGGPLGAEQRRAYEAALAANAEEILRLVRPDDVVLLHDPQTAGLTDALHETGAAVIWRAHVGLDMPNEIARRAWRFLRPYIDSADAYVFSRAAFAWDGLPQDRIAVIPPSIDAFSPKNEGLSPEHAVAILRAAGLLNDGRNGNAVFARSDGTRGRVDRRAKVVEESPLTPADRLVTQVSRWDQLKDPLGVLAGFASHVAPYESAHLVLAGPATESVTDDPEGLDVWNAVVAAREALPRELRTKVHLASLPMVDTEENAAIVNALQRHSEIVVQKSLAEGFGLTVAEAMWKARPVVASRIGGIQDQIEDGVSGRLIDDPRDLRSFGETVCALLGDEATRRRLGTAAQVRVRQDYLGPRHLGQYMELIQRLLLAREGEARDQAIDESRSAETTQ